MFFDDATGLDARVETSAGEKRKVRRSHEGSARAPGARDASEATRAQPRAVKPLVPSVSSFSNAAAKSSKKTF